MSIWPLWPKMQGSMNQRCESDPFGLNIEHWYERRNKNNSGIRERGI